MTRFAVCVHCGKRQSARVESRIPLWGSYITPRENEVLALRAQGVSIRKIGKSLSKSFHTVYTQLRSARERLNAHDNAHIVRLYKASPQFRERGRSNRDRPARGTLSARASGVDVVTGDNIAPGASNGRAL